MNKSIFQIKTNKFKQILSEINLEKIEFKK